MRQSLCLVLLLASLGSAQAACPAAAVVADLARQWAAMIPASGLDKDMTLADAECGQKLLLQELARTQGKVVGYKAGLTNPAVQKRFGHDSPVRGTLFEKMLLGDNAEVPARFGSRPVFEADMVVEVKDEGINQAKTPAEVLAHVSRIYPFIELPDLVLDPKETLNGPVLTAINVGARLGVLGTPFAATPEMAEALGSMTVVMRDTADGGKELGKGAGTSILGHPLNAVVWLAGDLARDGGRLKAGDLLSLGSFSPLVPPKPGMAVQVSYEGLPGNPTVRVRFK
jgi:2-keto-4-pentenoate hydratase